MQPDSTKLKKVHDGKRNQIDAKLKFKLERFLIATIGHLNLNPI